MSSARGKEGVDIRLDPVVLVAVGEEVPREKQRTQFLCELRRDGKDLRLDPLKPFVHPDGKVLADLSLVLKIASERALEEVDDAPARLGVVDAKHHAA